jgi:hypothetical protein
MLYIMDRSTQSSMQAVVMLTFCFEKFHKQQQEVYLRYRLNIKGHSCV